MGGQNLTRKILAQHLVSGELVAGVEIEIRIDQALTQDATGTLAYLQFGAIGISRIACELAVSYVDHNMLQADFRNADDHLYLQSAAAKVGAHFSRPGNGICHQVHLERFSVPGKTLLGSDSHTPTCGGAAMLAIGAGGLDVAVAMGGGPFGLRCPAVVGVKLTGRLQPWVSGKDVILELLRRRTVKGGVGKVFEYYGPGVASLDLASRATICNMGAELGATTSIFPSDERTREYFASMGREDDYLALRADEDAAYDEHEEIDLDGLAPMVAAPGGPDDVHTVQELAGLRLDQVCVGSCTNSSYRDLAVCATVLKGHSVAENLSMTLTPGSRNLSKLIAANGMLADLIDAGVRVLESACGPCIGMGQAPPSGGISLRTFNRNFPGRSGTLDAKVYLCSPETAAASALTGVLTDPRDLGPAPVISLPEDYHQDDLMLIPPRDGVEVEVRRGPNIVPLEPLDELPAELRLSVVLKAGDNVSTDDIMPAGASVLPYRSNIPKLAEFAFRRLDPDFYAKAMRLRERGGSLVLGGSNYGQGSSREHAGLVPRFLGVRVKLAKSFARIHRSNLINFGILPLTFTDPADYDSLVEGDVLILGDLLTQIARPMIQMRTTAGRMIEAAANFSVREQEILLAGGKLNWTRQNSVVSTR